MSDSLAPILVSSSVWGSMDRSIENRANLICLTNGQRTLGIFPLTKNTYAS